MRREPASYIVSGLSARACFSAPLEFLSVELIRRDMLPTASLWRRSSSSMLRGMKNSPVLPSWSFCIYRESQERERERTRRGRW